MRALISGRPAWAASSSAIAASMSTRSAAPRRPGQVGHDLQPFDQHGGGLAAGGLGHADLIEGPGQYRDREVGGLEVLEHLLGRSRQLVG